MKSYSSKEFIGLHQFKPDVINLLVESKLKTLKIP